MPCAFKPCALDINSISGFKREHVKSFSSTIKSIISLLSQCLNCDKMARCFVAFSSNKIGAQLSSLLNLTHEKPFVDIYDATNKTYCQLKPFLTHFWPVFPFYTPWKHQKTKGFLVFSGGMKWEPWPEMG